MSENTAALVIGASGGIGQEVVRQLSNTFTTVYAVSRNPIDSFPANVVSVQVDSSDEKQIKACCANIEKPCSLVICCTGILYEETAQHSLQPEKKLEDIDASNLRRYFEINSIVPALWMKHLVKVVKGARSSQLVFFSARVGSISDNRLGGWYGYRASKAALNMLIKTAQVEYARRCKQAVLVAYHPGTVDTELSKPFQSNVPSHKLFTTEFTVSQLLKVTASLSAENAPYYLDWDGKNIQW